MMGNPTRTHEPRKLTKRTVDAATPEDREYFVWDTEVTGFGLRVWPSGRKAFYLFYRTKEGARRKPQIGVYGNITPDEARQVAKWWHADIAKGGDPATERETARRQTLNPQARFEAVVDEFVEKYCKPRQKTWAQTERTLRHNCSPWRTRPMASITKADAYSLLDGFIADGHHHKARITHSWLKTLWRWAWKRDIVPSPLMDSVEIEIETRKRQRVYTDDELNALWFAADELTQEQGAYLKLLILTGVRKRELAGMRRWELDDADAPTLWTVPPERVKQPKKAKDKISYVIPLSPLARRVLKSLRGPDVIFPGRTTDSQLSPGTPLQRKIKAASGVKDFIFHGTRDTLATWLQNEGHDQYDRDLALNHRTSTGADSHYAHGHATQRKREIMDKWAEHVASVVAPAGTALLS